MREEVRKMGDSGRLIAIGDIHGCLPALETVLAAITPEPQDTLVLLGDYVDRGPQSREVIERVLALKQQCRAVPLLGNHDEMMLQVCTGQRQRYIEWLLFGGSATLQSYQTEQPEDVPAGVQF